MGRSFLELACRTVHAHANPRNTPSATHRPRMTTNQPSQPNNPHNGSRRVSNLHRRIRRGRSAPHHKTVAPPQPSVSPSAAAHQRTETPVPPPVETPATAAAGAAGRFEQHNFNTGTRKTAAPPPKQPQQSTQHSAFAKPVRLSVDLPFERTRLLVLALFMVPLCIWASFPSWESMVYEWYNTDDYSHGFLVIPVTLLFLYMRRDSYPGTSYKLDWFGLSPLLLYGVLRVFAGLQYIDFLDSIAIFFWIISVVWFFYGQRVFFWALPSLCFLVFMFQLPWRIDMLMRSHLQTVAAHSAAILLQMAGEAAIPINNVIRLSTTVLEVERACSGLRFLMSVFAIAFATVLLLRRPWWQNIIILAAAAPLALFVNAVRIALTGILLVRFPETAAAWTAEGQNAGAVADAFAGKITIFLALGLFALFVWYLGKVFRRVEI